MKINTDKGIVNRGKKNTITIMPAISLNSRASYLLHFKYIDSSSIRNKSFISVLPSPSSREILIYK